jgi:hypothetical protein
VRVRSKIESCQPVEYFDFVLINDFSWFDEKQKQQNKMAFCYRFKWRIPHPKEGNKLISFKLVVPFKSRKASNGRFGYSSLEGEHRLLTKALKFFKNRKYDKL